MHAPFHALTIRGRSFLAGGMTAAACGLLLGERAFLRLGLLALLVPVFSVVWVGMQRRRLQVDRHAAADQVPLGQPVEVQVRLRAGGSGTPALLVEERLPYALGARPRYVLPPLRAGGTTTLRYTVCGEQRGSHRLGPLRAQVSDPFGMLALSTAYPGSETLIVTPSVEPLPAVRLSGALAGSADDRPRAFTSGNAADVTVREYRRGDDLRRVHWRASAHHGELLVRREEQPWQARCTLVVDNRAPAHRGRGRSSSLEAAVSAAASIAVHLTDRGYDVHLVGASGDHLLPAGYGGGPAHRRALLRALAVLTAVDVARLSPAWMDEAASEGPLVAVLGAVGESDRAFFARLGARGDAMRALVLDVATWDAPAPSAHAGDAVLSGTRVLTSAGWRAAIWRRGEPLALPWQELAR